MTDVVFDESAPLHSRWSDFVIGRDDSRYGYNFDDIVRAGQRDGQPSLYVMGIGFDPRATVAFESAAPLLPANSKVVGIVPRSTRGASRESKLQQANAQRTEAIARRHGLTLQIVQPNPSAQDPRFHGNWLTRNLRTGPDWGTGHVIIDISSLPSPIFFALIRAWLATRTDGFQLQVVAAENHWLDDLIEDSGTLAPQFLPGFHHHGQVEELRERTLIWIPVLGHGRAAQLEAIADILNPQETCPVLPFPSIDPRRGDSLVSEYGEFLFEALQVDAHKFIYADAANPFDLHRVLLSISARYRRVFRPLGEPVIIPSAHGSKLLSLGVLLGAIDANLSVINAGAAHSRLSPEVDDAEIREVAATSHRTCLWIAGEPYELISDTGG